MTKIRIGNDIDIKFVFNSKDIDPTHIQSVEAYIVNKDLYKKAEDIRNKTYKFMSSYPASKFEQYLANSYCTKVSGYPTYFQDPHGCNIWDYCGFGVYPNWNSIYFKDRTLDFAEYRAQVKYTQKSGVIDILYPSNAQLYKGEYKLVVVAKVYEEGWGKDNLRTITIDVDDLFELVDSSDQADDIFIIEINMEFEAYYWDFGVQNLQIQGEPSSDNYEGHVLMNATDTLYTTKDDLLRRAVYFAVPVDYTGVVVTDAFGATEYDTTKQQNPIVINNKIFDLYRIENFIDANSDIKFNWDGK